MVEGNSSTLERRYVGVLMSRAPGRSRIGSHKADRPQRSGPHRRIHMCDDAWEMVLRACDRFECSASELFDWLMQYLDDTDDANELAQFLMGQSQDRTRERASLSKRYDRAASFDPEGDVE